MKIKDSKAYQQKLDENKVVSFDIDGVLIENHFPDYENGNPIEENIRLVNKLYDDGYIIVLNTARGVLTNRHYRKKTREQMKKHGIKYHYLFINKPPANYYIDDRNATIGQMKGICNATANVSANNAD